MTANQTSVIRIVFAIALAMLIIVTSSCQGARHIFPASQTKEAAPFVEAFLEYVGPPERWAGPRTVSYRVSAREPEARAELGDLGQSMLETGLPFAGCLYPVRARLVRADGSVLEQQGCRGNSGWPVAAGRVISSALDSVRQDRAPGSRTAHLSTKKAWEIR
jgi:hypothetical protein